jgi:transposase
MADAALSPGVVPPMEANVPFHSTPYSPLPPDTARAAKSVFNIENAYLALGDQLDVFCDDLNWDDLNAFREKPTSVLFVLAMVTIFQFAEDMPDHQAADALGRRMDWKYALHLPADYPGFPPSELIEFRQRLAGNQAGQLVFQCLLNRLAKLGLLGSLGSRDKVQVDAQFVLSAVDTLSRVDRATEALGRALEALAARDHEWLRAVSPPHWYERYGHESGSRGLPSSREDGEAVVRWLEADISYLLEAIDQRDSPDLAGLLEVQALRRTWQRDVAIRDSSTDPNTIRR